jgi:hypothetical protein
MPSEGNIMSMLKRKTDCRGRLTLPTDFADCFVTVERVGEEIIVRKVKRVSPRRYSFKQLMAAVTAKSIHAEIKTGSAVGSETL